MYATLGLLQSIGVGIVGIGGGSREIHRLGVLAP